MNARSRAFAKNKTALLNILVSPFSLDHVAGFPFYSASHPPVPWRMSSHADAVEESYVQEDTERRAAQNTGASRSSDSAQHASSSLHADQFEVPFRGLLFPLI